MRELREPSGARLRGRATDPHRGSILHEQRQPEALAQGVKRALALAGSALLLMSCSEDAKPRAANAPDVRAEFALLSAGLPIKQVEAVCADEGESGCARLGVRATSTASPDQLRVRLSTALQQQRWKIIHSSCQGLRQQCAVAATKAGEQGLLTLNFTAGPEVRESTSVRISVFYP